jgi:hypothetical protein
METRSKRVTRVLCAAGPQGSAEAVERLLQAAGDLDVQAVAVVGDLGGGPDRAADYRALFQALGRAGWPAYWVPGPADAPIEEYLREAQNIEVVFPFVRGVHGTAAFAPDGHIVFAGFGGHVSDDPAEPREELQALRYPRWEPEYRLKVRNELHEHQLVLLLATPPAHTRASARREARSWQSSSTPTGRGSSCAAASADRRRSARASWSPQGASPTATTPSRTCRRRRRSSAS